MKYTAINIGPILKTLGLARKPRELWSASFLFSDLMRYIIAEVPENLTILSPAECSPESGVGLYPDRLFIKGEISDKEVLSISDKAWDNFRKEVFPKQSASIRKYFSIMSASVDFNEDYMAIQKLNSLLDRLELNVTAVNSDVSDVILDLIMQTYGSPLFRHGFGEREFDVETIGEIATAQFKENKKEEWGKFKEYNRDDNFKADPYKEAFSDCKEYKTYHRYYCIVQADGDNVGSYLTSTSLKNNDLPKVSEALLTFGQRAKSIIEDEYGGMTIYAGGDDLLFIAPVVGKDGKTTVFDLLASLDDNAFSPVRKYIDNASLSFGVSVNYYKFPLYEALNAARDNLFGVAKKVPGKKAVAWTLQKHSGEQFSASFSRTVEDLWKQFIGVIENTSDGNTVSAVAHKLLYFEPLVSMTLASKESVRLKALFDKVLEMKDNPYFTSVMEIMPTLYNAYGDNYLKTLYAVLRIAKFVKGEEPIDE